MFYSIEYQIQAILLTKNTSIKMGPLTKVIVIFFIAFAFTAPIIHGKPQSKQNSGSDSKSCADVKCINPPSNAICTIVKNMGNSSIPKPSGKNAECCPVWKCQKKDQVGKSEFFTFHGMPIDSITYFKKECF